MNIQAMMKKLQKDMIKTKEEINAMTFEGKSSFVTVEVDGDKNVKKVLIDQEHLEKEDIELLQDMLVVAINEAMKQVDKITEEKMGKFTQGMPGLF